jgi:hypothetical protein
MVLLECIRFLTVEYTGNFHVQVTSRGAVITNDDILDTPTLSIDFTIMSPGNIGDILSNFDQTYCQWAYDGYAHYCTPETLVCYPERYSYPTRNGNKVDLQSRTRKAKNKGYTLWIDDAVYLRECPMEADPYSILEGIMHMERTIPDNHPLVVWCDGKKQKHTEHTRTINIYDSFFDRSSIVKALSCTTCPNACMDVGSICPSLVLRHAHLAVITALKMEQLTSHSNNEQTVMIEGRFTNMATFVAVLPTVHPVFVNGEDMYDHKHYTSSPSSRTDQYGRVQCVYWENTHANDHNAQICIGDIVSFDYVNNDNGTVEILQITIHKQDCLWVIKSILKQRLPDNADVDAYLSY